MNTKQQNHGTSATRVDMKLEVEIIPVSDVERSKRFYQRLGWRFDDDVSPVDGVRIVQLTPQGSTCSVTFGKGITAAAPGSAEGALVVSDIEAAHDDLIGRGIYPTDVWHGPPFPREGTATRPRSETHQLWVVLILQRSRRQYVASPGGDDARSRPGLIRRFKLGTFRYQPKH